MNPIPLAESLKEDNKALRMFIALKVLRAWNSGAAGFSGTVVSGINKWIDDGMEGPVPWPRCPFFDEWAKGCGLSNVGPGYIGFRFRVHITDPITETR